MLQIRFLDWGHLKTKTNRRVSHVTLTYFGPCLQMFGQQHCVVRFSILHTVNVKKSN